MAELSFDDLIPARPTPHPTGLSFDDLIPPAGRPAVREAAQRMIAKPNQRVEEAFAVATPQRAPSTPARDNILAATGGAIEGIPVLGGPMREGLNMAGAAKRSLLNDTPYSDELAYMRAEQERLKSEKPIVSTAANVAGAIAASLPAAATTAGASALGITGRSLATRAAKSAATGATVGGADAATRGNDPGLGTVMGGGFGAAAPIAGQAIGAASRAILRKVPKVPDLDSLRDLKTLAYQQVDTVGARYTPKAYDTLLQRVRQDLVGAKISRQRHPKAVSMFEDMVRVRGGQPSLTELDQLRQVIRRDVVNSGDEAEAFFGSMMMDRIDDFVNSATPKQMAAGNAKDASTAINTARALNARYRKAEMVEDAVTRAVRRANSTGSGGNVENAIRQNIRQILDNPKKVRGFSKEERAVMEKIVQGSKGQNLARLVGKLSPSGNGLMAALGIGATVVNPMYAIPAGAGIVAKNLAEGATNQRVQALESLVRTGAQPSAGPSLAAPAANLLIRSLAPDESR